MSVRKQHWCWLVSLINFALTTLLSDVGSSALANLPKMRYTCNFKRAIAAIMYKNQWSCIRFTVSFKMTKWIESTNICEVNPLWRFNLT